MAWKTLLESPTGAVTTLTLDRPDKLNALSREMLGELAQAFGGLARDARTRCVVLTGAGDKAFAAGADIAEMAEMSVAEAKAFSDLGHALCASIEEAPFAVVGAVNGYALGGGCELALACDFLYASDRAAFGQPEVSLGVMPGFGGTQRLARRVGLARARELCMTGDRIGAEEALRIGLVNAVVPHAELARRAQAVAEKIASRGPLAVRACKRVMHRGQDVPLPTANELEAAAFAGLFGSADQREGMAAFLAKRAPAFRGE